MFQEIDAECYIMVDGDDTYPAEAAKEMAEKVLNDHLNMVVGDRLSSTYFEENKRPFHFSLTLWSLKIRSWFFIETYMKCDVTNIW